MNSTFKRPPSYWLALATLVLGVLLRFLYLDADPYYYNWIGYITDEGRWVQNARSLALFGTSFDHGNNLHFLLAPLFQLANYLVFVAAGVSVLTSRIFTALAGSAILVVFWRGLRSTTTPQAMLLGITFLAFQADLVMLSRVAVPEMVIMLFQLLIYFMLVLSEGTRRRMLFAGVMLWLGVAMKATMLAFLPICLAIILFMPRESTETRTTPDRWRDVMWFSTGFAVPFLVVGVIWFGCCAGDSSSVAEYLSVIRQRVGLSGAYDVMSFPFEHAISPTFNVWALGLWLSMLAWMASGRDSIDSQSRRFLVTSTIWFALYFSLMLLMAYFPTRYKVHILIPMAVIMAIGISLLQRLGIQKVIGFFVNVQGPSGLLRLGILSLPTAVFAAPLLASIMGLTGTDPSRLRVKFACVLVAWIATTFVVERVRRNKQTMSFLFMFPIIAGMAWLFVETVREGGFAFWPSPETQFHAASWSLFLLVASGFSTVMARTGADWEPAGCARFVTVAAMGYLTISLVGVAPGYMDPHYSIRDTSRDLGRLLGGSCGIVAQRAEGLFNGNSLRYSSYDRHKWKSEPPEIMVIVFTFDPEASFDGWLRHEYQLVKSYNLYVSPEYLRLRPNGAVVPEAPGEVIRVYQRKSVDNHLGPAGERLCV